MNDEAPPAWSVVKRPLLDRRGDGPTDRRGDGPTDGRPERVRWLR